MMADEHHDMNDADIVQSVPYQICHFYELLLT